MAFATKWYYNSSDGAVEQHDETTFIEAHLPWFGWHGPFDTKQEALDYYTANVAANPGWHAPSGLLQQVAQIPQTINTNINNAGSEATSAIGNAVKTDILGNVNLQSWLVRIGEILLGLVLVGVALAKMSGTSNVITKALKVGALA